MGLRIQNNVEAFNTHRQLSVTSMAASKSMEKLSSGYRINRAADDAAGLGISEKMRGQIGGLAQAQRNAQDGISLVQTAEGALNEVHSMLQRVRDLKVQFNNGTNSSDDKDAIAAEVFQISQEIGDIVSDTKFNGTAVFGSGTFSFQVGANDSETVATSAASLSRSACWALIFSIRSSSSARTSEMTMWRQITIAKRQMTTLATMPASSARQTASKRSWSPMRLSTSTRAKTISAPRVRARRIPALARGCWAIETTSSGSSPFSALPLPFSFSFAISLGRLSAP